MSHTVADFNLTDPVQNNSVSRFYDGKSVFLTGGTGFIGKVILEKLLRACPGVVKIFFLIRPKKGLDCTERLRKIFEMPLFTKLKEMDPEAFEKVVAVPGDITHQRLGISDEDWNMVAAETNVVIHSAAAVRFDEPIRIAMEMNVIAVKEIIKLVRDMKNLVVFCHISTAYSQCNRDSNDVIDERFYPTQMKAQDVIDAMKWMDDDMLNAATESMIGRYPNTYTFTKALTESMLNDECRDLPLVIIRPSIVCASIEDPLPGWIDNYNGVVGVIVAVGKGILRTLLIPGMKNDIVPVDLVSNCILVSIWYHATTKPSDPFICNCTSGNVNPTTFQDMERTCQETMHVYPYNSIFRRPNVRFTRKRLIHNYWQVVSHYIPAIIADGISIMVGSKPRFMNVYKKMNSSLQTFEFFISNEWNWSNSVYSRILQSIPSDEKETFDFDMRKIDWENYYRALTLGIKVYVVKDDMKELPKARRLIHRYKMVRWMSSILFILFVGRVFFTKSAQFRRLWFEALFGIYRLLRFLKVTSFST
jgi:fatty acyl-CoA reductase